MSAQSTLESKTLNLTSAQFEHWAKAQSDSVLLQVRSKCAAILSERADARQFGDFATAVAAGGTSWSSSSRAKKVSYADEALETPSDQPSSVSGTPKTPKSKGTPKGKTVDRAQAKSTKPADAKAEAAKSNKTDVPSGYIKIGKRIFKMKKPKSRFLQERQAKNWIEETILGLKTAKAANVKQDIADPAYRLALFKHKCAQLYRRIINEQGDKGPFVDIFRRELKDIGVTDIDTFEKFWSGPTAVGVTSATSLIDLDKAVSGIDLSMPPQEGISAIAGFSLPKYGRASAQIDTPGTETRMEFSDDSVTPKRPRTGVEGKH